MQHKTREENPSPILAFLKCVITEIKKQSLPKEEKRILSEVGVVGADRRGSAQNISSRSREVHRHFNGHGNRG